jgi:hypothetical protein
MAQRKWQLKMVQPFDYQIEMEQFNSYEPGI